MTMLKKGEGLRIALFLGTIVLMLIGVVYCSTIVFASYETMIDGDFNGWEGETVYKLMSGRVIQQSSYHYHYHYAYNPEVIIYEGNGCTRIHVVDDDDEDVCITFLK